MRRHHFRHRFVVGLIYDVQAIKVVLSLGAIVVELARGRGHRPRRPICCVVGPGQPQGKTPTLRPHRVPHARCDLARQPVQGRRLVYMTCQRCRKASAAPKKGTRKIRVVRKLRKRRRLVEGALVRGGGHGGGIRWVHKRRRQRHPVERSRRHPTVTAAVCQGRFDGDACEIGNRGKDVHKLGELQSFLVGAVWVGRGAHDQRYTRAEFKVSELVPTVVFAQLPAVCVR